MMKTKIVICCDSCGSELDDFDMCFGYMSNNSTEELYICTRCIDLVKSNIDSSIRERIFNNTVSSNEEICIKSPNKKIMKDIKIATLRRSSDGKYIVLYNNKDLYCFDSENVNMHTLDIACEKIKNSTLSDINTLSNHRKIFRNIKDKCSQN